jgi:hypothetical protein
MATIWKRIPDYVNLNNIEVSNFGDLRCSSTKYQIQQHKLTKHTTRGYYAGITVDRFKHYIHRLVYAAFHPEIDVRKGRVLYRKAIAQPDGTLRCHLEDLMFMPLSPNGEHVAENPMETVENHPIYGEVVFGKWIQARVPNGNTTRPLATYEGMFTNDAEFPFVLRSKRGDTWRLVRFSPSSTCFQLSVRNETKVHCNLTHMMLATAFPNAPPNETVDHRNNNHLDNSLFNLEWMTRSANSSKAHEAVTNVRNGHIIDVISNTGDTLMSFPSICAAARFVVDNIRNRQGLELTIDTVDSKIRMVVNGSRKTAYGYRWKISEDANAIRDEEWRDLRVKELDDGNAVIMTVSNKGRFKNRFGTVSRGTKLRDSNYHCFRSTYIDEEGVRKCVRLYAHVAVYLAFNGTIGANQVVRHGNDAPKLADGSYRNWAEDLTIGSRTDNVNDHNDALRMPMDVDGEDVISSILEESTCAPLQFSRRDYNVQASDVPIPELYAMARIKSGIVAIYDDKHAEIMGNLTWTPGDSMSVTKELRSKFPILENYKSTKITPSAFVYHVLEGNHFEEGKCVKPIDLRNEDMRMRNLTYVEGGCKDIQKPKVQRLPKEFADEMEIEYLPKYVSIVQDKRSNKWMFNVSLKGTKANCKRAAKKSCYREHLVPFLKKWYEEQQRDFEEEHRQYVGLLDEFYRGCESVGV